MGWRGGGREPEPRNRRKNRSEVQRHPTRLVRVPHQHPRFGRLLVTEDAGLASHEVDVEGALHERELCFKCEVQEKRDFSLRRPTHSQERMRKKESACSVRNDGVAGAADSAVHRERMWKE
jgi:hypothetical protein